MLNTAYAFIAEELAAQDRAARPVYLAAGVKPEEVEQMMRRYSLDTWLEAPPTQVAEAEAALERWLRT